MVKRFFIILLSLLSLPVFASVQGTVTSRVANIAEKITYTVTISGEKNVIVNLPERKFYYGEDKDVPLFEITSATYDNKGIVEIEVLWYQAGKFILPSVDIKNADGADIVYSLPEVEVKQAATDTVPAEDELPGSYYGYPYRLVIMMLLWGLLVALVVYIVFRIVKKRAPELPSIPAITIFEKEANEILSRLQELSAEEYADQMSSVFKKFVSAHYSVNAEELTTGEIGDYLRLKYRRSGAEKAADVESALNMLDMIKFAEAQYSPDLITENAKRIIKSAMKLSLESPHGI